MTRAPPRLPVPDLDHLTLRQPPDSRVMSPACGLAAMKLMNSWRSASDQTSAAVGAPLERGVRSHLPPRLLRRNGQHCLRIRPRNSEQCSSRATRLLASLLPALEGAYRHTK
jgi:hypothetical protein